MLLVPISFAGAFGGDAEAPGFDVTYPPGPAAAATDVRPSLVGEAVLRASAASVGRAASGADRSSLAGPPPETVSAGAAVAEASAAIEPVTEETTDAPVLATARNGRDRPEPSASPSRSGLSIELPLDLGSTLRTLTGGASEQGGASWFDAPAGTCAHQTLPFGTVVKVTSLLDGVSTTCEVDDRGPFIDGRVIDLSRDVFEALAHPGAGVIDVLIEW